MFSNTYVSKLQISSETVYTKLDWIQNDHELFKLQVVTPGRDWSGTGTYTMQMVKQHCEVNFQIDSEYCENAKKCLSGESSQDEYKFGLSTDDETGISTFTWKKRFGDIYQLQGALPLYKDEKCDCKTALIDFLIDKNKDLRGTITEMEHKAEVVNAELEKCKQELDKFVDDHKNMEQILYGKFVQLLNAKKQRIKLLENQLKS